MTEAQDKYEFSVQWHPFLLRPDMPTSGAPKVGNRVNDHLKTAGQAVGIDFTGKSSVYPYTLKAHVVLEMAKADLKLQNNLAETLFKAYFTDGSTLDDASLVALAESVGMARSEVEAAINNQDKLKETFEAAISWSNKGVTGVPHFYMNDQRTFSGAQDSATFLRMFEIISEKFPVGTDGKAASL